MLLRRCGSTPGTTLGIAAGVIVVAPAAYFGARRGWTALALAKPAVAKHAAYLWTVFSPAVKLKAAMGLELSQHPPPLSHPCELDSHRFRS